MGGQLDSAELRPDRVGSGRVVSRRAVRTVLALVVMTVAVSCVPVVRDGEGTPRYQPPAGSGPYAELDLRRSDGTEVGLADPEVLRSGDRWYLYGTSSTAGFEAWSSGDLVEWRYEGLVWRPTGGSWNDTGSFWAPHVVRDGDGSLLLYYTAGERIGVARAARPTGPFVDLLDHPLVGGGFGGVGDGLLVSTGSAELDRILNGDDVAIDAASVDLDDGTRVLYSSASLGPGPATIYASHLIDDAVVAPGPPTQVLSVELLGWEGVTREAPIVERRGDRYVLTYSGSTYLNTCYAVGQAEADSPFGPFRRVAPGPFLHDDPTIGFFGPGHHSFTTGPDGSPLIFFHTRDAFEGGGERHTRWAAVTEDGDGRLRMVDPPGRVGAGRSSCWPFP